MSLLLRTSRNSSKYLLTSSHYQRCTPIFRSFHVITGNGDNDREHDQRNNKTAVQFTCNRSFSTKPALSIAALRSYSNTNTTMHKYISMYSNNILTRAKSTLTNENNDTNDTNDNSNPKEEGQSKQQQMKSAARKGSKAVKYGATSIRDLVRNYGWTFIGTYLSIYVVTLTSLFAGLDTGLVDPTTLMAKILNLHVPWHETAEEAASGAASDQLDFDSTVDFVSSYMKKFTWTEPYADVILRNPHMTNLAVAWVSTKFTEPIRLPLSIAIVRHMKKNEDDSGSGTHTVSSEGNSDVQDFVHDAVPKKKVD